MKNTYPITQEQIDLLNTFTCERLSTDPDNLSKIQNFHSGRGRGLVNHLRDQGWTADKSGTTAYYVIKNPQGRIMMFFSLKCGVLFDPHYFNRCAEEFTDAQRLWRAWNQARCGDESAQAILDEFRRDKGEAAYKECIRDLEVRYYHSRGVIQLIKRDKRDEPNDKMIRVDKALRESFSEAKLLLQVHDELIVECPEGIAAEVAAIVSREMEGIAALSVPLTAEAKWGESWYDAK